MKIQVLSDDTINKIAAGEVIERPASVVKELVENSLDSGAKKIDIEVSEGGKSLIRVTDDGCGMTKEDALLAFERHATSKITSADDLFKVNTLGFRGEALPSIASISKIEMVTRANESDNAIRIKIDGGKFLEVREAGAPYGTMISVKNIFFNTPARRKFLKANQTEFSHIMNVVSHYALTFNQCGITLKNNDDNVIEIFQKDSLIDRIRILYGNDVAEGIAKIDYESNGIRVTGFAGLPTLSRPNKSLQFFYVNKRPVASKPMNFAVYHAYSSLIPKDRYPAVFIFLEIAPDIVDVNVHPAKKEVRFGNDREIQEAVQIAVVNALQLKPEAAGTAREGTHFTYSNAMPTELWSAETGVQYVSMDIANKAVQMHNAYIINQVEDGIEIIDQHAVHERILYERIKESPKNKEENGQRLLIPINVELTVKEEKILKENIDYFKELGFNIEDFGGRSVIIDAIPDIMEKVDIKKFIKDALSELEEKEMIDSPSNGVKEKLMKSMACRSAVMQGDTLNSHEIQNILNDWKKLDLPYTCPHGRPAVVKITKEELGKKFRRT